MMSKKVIVGIYSLIHCIVDFSCATLIIGILSTNVKNTEILPIGIFFYNLFAFGFQLPFGVLADKLNKNAIVSIIGCFSIIIAYCIKDFCIISCIVAGVGNALFHVGGGIDILKLSNKKATLPGIFVATRSIRTFFWIRNKIF